MTEVRQSYMNETGGRGTRKEHKSLRALKGQRSKKEEDE